MATILPPNQFCSAGAPHDAPPAETLPAMVSGTEHPMAGSRFSIDEKFVETFFHAINPSPLAPLPVVEPDNMEAVEIEQVLRALFARTG